jgi:hypothetical protein
MELMNGGVYKHKHRTFALVYFYHNDSYGMLSICEHVVEGMSAPGFQYDKEGEHQFTRDELINNWDAENWTLLDGRLRIEKIDKEMRLVGYTIGELEEYTGGY